MNRGAAITTGSLLFDPLRPTLPASVLEEVEQYDDAFVNNRSFTMLHIITGSIFLFAAPIQLSPYVRKHHIGIHRWCGRITIVISLAAGISALVLVIPFTFTGIASTSAVTIFGALFVTALIMAFVAIRRKDVQKHREWMIRAICIGFGISVVRIVGAILILINGVPTFGLLGLSFWLGWLLSVAAGEVYLHRTKLKLA